MYMYIHVYMMQGCKLTYSQGYYNEHNGMAQHEVERVIKRRTFRHYHDHSSALTQKNPLAHKAHKAVYGPAKAPKLVHLCYESMSPTVNFTSQKKIY